MERLKELFIERFGKEPASVEKMPGAGSNRVYYRLTGEDGKTCVGVIGTQVDENRAFLYLANHFGKKGLPVPEVYAVSSDEMCYLQQDLGNRSLYDAVKHGRETGEYNDYERDLLVKTIRLLPAFQYDGVIGLDPKMCYPQPQFDKQTVMFDLNYFKYCFLKGTGVEFNEMRLEKEFNSFADSLTTEYVPVFMYRDFQARNVMLDENDEPYFIDFQGGRVGPGFYDVASFVFQASARYSLQLKKHLLSEYYIERLNYVKQASIAQNLVKLNEFITFRLLQVLGAYGFRGFFERKPHFLKSMPAALDILEDILERGAFKNYPYLGEVCQEVVDNRPKPFVHEGLIVRVFSFSYKKGIPDDVSGNGGGYVFDCRSTNNPGRYEEYKRLTGRDKEVIEFLEKDGEIVQFLDNIYPLVDFHVERWLERGFKDLQVSFGCTGGQHRSVYSAQHVAEHIHQKYGVEVHLCHREQGITEIMK